LQGLDTRYSGGKAWLVFSQPILFNGSPVGFIVAETEASRVVRRFLDRGEPDNPHRHAALVDAGGLVVDSNSDRLWRNWRRDLVPDDETVLESPLYGTRFHLVSLPDEAINQGILTSPLFLAALGLMGLAVFAGVIHLWRLNSHNLVLRTRYESTAQQRIALSKQNELLQREINKRIESEQKLAHQANFDQLTGLPNRNLALDRLAQAVKWARREQGRVLTLFVDLDRFKQVNDSLGHAAGDELLREAAQRLKHSVRDSDTVSRLGGDEFLVICPEIAGGDDWERCAEQLLKVLSAPFYIGDHEFFVGASIGVAVYPDAGSEPDKLLKNADIAMYAAKEKGRNRFCRYEPSMDAVAMESMRLERNLRHALKRDEFYLMYQPIVELSSGRTVAVETLLRWRSRELGEVDPTHFIPIAEETGLIHEIGEWVLQEACRSISNMGVDSHFRLAVNLSSKQFSRAARLLDCVLCALRDSGLMPNQLELEITETILIDDRSEISDLINQLDRIGVRLSIDDFGTGYSALNYLQRFPFDVLKIDHSFTKQVPGSGANASLIRAIIAMAHALGLEVVAEGIESREQAGFLLVYHCEYGQGYHYSRPMMADQLRRHLIGDAALTA
jgi:diguanylate cyclase (GGDEF)-like protein